MSGIDPRFPAIGASQLTAAAKYIATLMLATGARSPTQLRALSGLGKTTVYRVQAEIFESEVAYIFEAIPVSPESPTSPAIPADGNKASPTSPADGKITEKSVPQVPPMGLSEPEPSCARDITTRPTKELPSEVVILNNITPLSAPPASKTKRQTGTRGSRLPDDWELPEDWRQWTLCNCPVSTPEAVDREALIFANYWQSLAGQKATKTDWRKTWQNWTMRTFASGPVRPPRTFARPDDSWQERRRQNARIIMELASKPREVDLVQ